MFYIQCVAFSVNLNHLGVVVHQEERGQMEGRREIIEGNRGKYNNSTIVHVYEIMRSFQK